VTPIRYHEAAEAELLDEIGYLELRAKGLGQRFLLEVKRAEGVIAEFPESCEEIRPGIRKTLVRKFRHSLIYTIENNGLLILAVAHQSRRAGYWVNRADSRARDKATDA
jgi:plasmid stabilization system protein ParE